MRRTIKILASSPEALDMSCFWTVSVSLTRNLDDRNEQHDGQICLSQQEDSVSSPICY